MQQRGLYRARGVVGVVLMLAMVVAGVPTTANGLATTDGGELTQQTTPINNTTIQHEDPTKVSQSGDSQQVSQWLQSRLTRQLDRSAVNISQAQYDQARDVIGEDYDTRLEQYVNVAGETDSEADDQVAETLNQTKQDQRALASDIQSYNETYQEYQEARAAGNTTAARSAARKLETLSERINRQNSSLTQNYGQLQNSTGINTSRAQTTISETTQTVQSQQEAVRAATFTRTELTVSTNGSKVAFNDPMAIDGRVLTANGTAVSNQSVPITIHNRTYNARTDSEGRFTLSYRPVTLPVNATTVEVAYRPRGSSPYLGTETRARVNVTQVTPTIDVRVTPAAAGYRTLLNTTATATVDGRHIPQLPLRSRLSGTVRNGQTDMQGRTLLSQRLAARIPTGEQSVRVVHPNDDLAVGPATGTAPMTVTATPTTSIITAAVNDSALCVTGRLVTEQNQPVSGQTVDVRVGSQVQTVTTNATGGYQLTVSNLSRAVAANTSTAQVIAEFDGTGTNLDSSEASTSVSIPRADTSNASNTLSIQRMLLGGITLLGLILVAGVVAWSRSGTSSPGTAETDSVDTEGPTEAESIEQTETWLNRSREALSADEFERAIAASYAAMRTHVNLREGLDGALTHREFVTATQDRLPETDQESIRTIADAYEQVMFAGNIDTADAAGAVEAAERIQQRTAES